MLIDLVAFGGFALRPQHEKVEKATQLLSDGNCSDGDAPQPPMLQAPPPAIAQDAVEAAVLKNRIPNVEVPPQCHPSPHTPKFIFVDASLGFGFGGLEAIAAG